MGVEAFDPAPSAAYAPRRPGPVPPSWEGCVSLGRVPYMGLLELFRAHGRRCGADPARCL